MINTMDEIEDTPNMYVRKSIPVSLIPGCTGPSCPHNNDTHCWKQHEESQEDLSKNADIMTVMVYVGDEYRPELLSLEMHQSFQAPPGFSYDELLARYTIDEIQNRIRMAFQRK